MLRPIPFFLGLLLLFAVLPTPSHASSKRVTSNKAKVNHAAKASAVRANTTRANATRANATRANAKRKAAELKVKPAQPPAESPAPTTAPTAAASGSPPPTRGPTRIDFDDRLIQGQTNKSGAVYLYDRKELKTPSMIKKRESFREEIVATIYGN
jgi:hypothetical protein